MYAQMVGFAELPPPPGTRFATVRLVAETGSTNADLLAEASTGAPEGLVLVTDHQRAGRGRQRRVWHDEPGSSLLVSVLLRPAVATAPLIPLVTGLAAVDAVGDVVGRDRLGSGGDDLAPGADRVVGLKWPNDVLAPGHGERKLAGILAEAATPPDRHGEPRLVVVVGMGMNLRWGTPPPDEVAARAVTLTEIAGRPVDRDEVLTRFLVGLERWLSALEAGEPVLDAYRSACLTLGRIVRFTTAGGEYRGTAVDISPGGTLLLETGDGEVVELNAGDAHHVGPRSGPEVSRRSP